ELTELRIAEDNEVRRILYELTGAVEACGRELSQNVACMETLDFLFAKARLSAKMKASEPKIVVGQTIVIRKGRHPLLDADRCVPLDFEIGGNIRGVIITGPNTGGKTVALKTVGLLSLMAQSGLHTPAEAGTVFGMQGRVLADIGDGQSIAENLSTFSSHMTNIIAILEATTHESLVLLDELGSGTDPAEGMGLALSILEALRASGCLFVATSHYPQIKTYAAQTEGLINARMTFDRDSLAPLYALEMGEAGESCALYIAQRLGFPEPLLQRARDAAYGLRQDAPETLPEMPALPARAKPSVLRKASAPPDAPRRCDSFAVGDSVRVYPQKEIGRVYR
ncbi:MAG TPA: DNA mismatch repair protein MutS, partial [Clostridia bacterium]|nr:DNA mismatch repair protein MutS [Clostridia bacterium]